MPQQGNAFHRATLDALDAYIAVLDGTGTTIAVNAALERLIERNPGCELRVGANYLQACEAAPADDRGRAVIACGLREMLDGHLEGFGARYEVHPRDGARRWLDARSTRYRGAGPGRIVMQHHDCTDLVAAERSARLRSKLLDEIDAAVIGCELDGTIEVWSRGAEKVYGWTAAEAVGRNVAEFVMAPESQPAPLRAGGVERQLRRKDGSVFSGYLSSVVYHDEHGKPAGVISVTIDAAETMRAAGELRQARDHLRAVTDTMGEALLTLDDAGRVTYMTAAAEQVLGWSVEALRGRTLHEAVHFRHPDGSPFPLEQSPLMLGHRARETVRVEEDMFVRRDGTNIPVAYVLAPFESAEGDGSVIVFSDITRMKSERRRLQAESERLANVRDLQEAMDEQRFELYAQPIIDLNSGSTVSHELLLRMRERDGSMRLPGSFLPVAERSGLIRELDRWVIRQAAGLAAEGYRVELNLSALSLGDQGLYDDFADAIAETGADPGHIVIELTETALMQDEAMATAFVERVGVLGCELALDDFGTGFGGFSYLKNLPVDFLKIDVEFVRDLRTNLASRHVVQAVIGLARSFGQKTVAEGVEDDATLDIVREMGVDYAQGYGIGRPGPLDETLYSRV